MENATLEFGAVDPKTGDVPQWTTRPRTGQGRGSHEFPERRVCPSPPRPTRSAFKVRVTRRSSRVHFGERRRSVIDYYVMLVPGNPPGRWRPCFVPTGNRWPAPAYSTATLNQGLSLNDGVVSERAGDRGIITGADGTFPIPQDDGPFMF